MDIQCKLVENFKMFFLFIYTWNFSFYFFFQFLVRIFGCGFYIEIYCYLVLSVIFQYIIIRKEMQGIKNYFIFEIFFVVNIYLFFKRVKGCMFIYNIILSFVCFVFKFDGFEIICFNLVDGVIFFKLICFMNLIQIL